MQDMNVVASFAYLHTPVNVKAIKHGKQNYVETAVNKWDVEVIDADQKSQPSEGTNFPTCHIYAIICAQYYYYIGELR